MVVQSREQKREALLAELAEQSGPMEKVHLVCLVYLQGGQLDDGTFVAMISQLFSRSEALAWLRHPEDLRKFAKLVSQRDAVHDGEE